MMSAHAPFLLNGPPGQILVKLAPNYTDQLDNNGLLTGRIVTYATFWWSGRLIFKGKARTPRQWNTYNLPDIPEHKNHKSYLPNEIGQFEIPFMPGRVLPNYTA